MAWWPLGRSRRETAGADTPAAPQAALPQLRPAAADGAWRDLPGLQRALAEPLRPVAISDDFRASLAAHTDPSFVAPLTHRVDPLAGGLVDGLVSAGQPHPHPSVAELPVPPRPPSAPAPRVQRRVEWSGSADLPTVGWELPGLLPVDPADSSPPAPMDLTPSDVPVAVAEADSGPGPLAPSHGTFERAETRTPSPAVSTEDSGVGAVRPSPADLPVTPVATAAPVVSRSVDPAAESGPLSGFAAAISNPTGVGAAAGHEDEPAEDSAAAGPTVGAAVQRSPDVGGGAGSRPTIGGVAEQRLDPRGRGTADQRAVASVSRDQTNGVSSRPELSAAPSGVQVATAGIGAREVPIASLPVQTLAADQTPAREPVRIQTLATDSLPVLGSPAPLAPSPLAPSPLAPSPLVPRPPTSGAGSPAAAGLPAAAAAVRPTSASLPVVSRFLGEVGVRVVDPVRSSTGSTSLDRNTDVPTLRPRLEQTPMVVQRTSLGSTPSSRPEPPVQRIEFLSPLGAETPRPPAPATGSRTAVDAPPMAGASQPLRSDSDSAQRVAAPATLAPPPPRVLASPASPDVQRLAADPASHHEVGAVGPSEQAAFTEPALSTEPTLSTEPALLTEPISALDSAEANPAPMLSDPSGPAVATESWQPESSRVESPHPESPQPEWSPLETAQVAGGSSPASYAPRVGQPSPAVAVGPAMPVQRSTHPMESPSGTQSSSPLVISRQAASPGPSEIGRSSGGTSFASMFGSAHTGWSGETGSAAADGYTSVQLAPADDAPAPSEPASEPAAAPAASSGAPPAPAGAPPTDLDEMARRLYEPLSARLRAELWLDRERAGVMSDV